MRRKYASEAAQRFIDNEAAASTDDDLDILTTAQKQIREKSTKRFTDRLQGSDSPSSSDHVKESVAIEFTDSDNEGRSAFQKFQDQNKKRKRPKATTTGVGKRAAKKKKLSPKEKRLRHDPFGSDTDIPDDAIEQDLPEYLKARRADFKKNNDLFGDTGLKLPPTYDDIDFSDDERLGSLKEKPQFVSSMKPPAEHADIALNYSAGVIPAPIAQWLKPYQVKGTAFLHELFVYQKGGLLGDDMGLGKTIQVIAALTAAFGKTGDERDAKRMNKMRKRVDTRWYPRVLIICPGSLMSNWRSELKKWGFWRVYTFHGSVDARDSSLKAAKSGMLEIMITTYATYRNYAEDVNSIAWDACIADECHTIKERKSDTAKSMLVVNALCRIGLSGTAIQNKYEEFWTLLNWTNPGKFGPHTIWKSAISEPLKLGQSHDATAGQLKKARTVAKQLVNNLLPEFFLRRMKSLIADQLPKKSDRVVFCPLTEDQEDAYRAYLDSDIIDYIKTSTEMCWCSSNKKKGWCCQQYVPSTGLKWQSHILASMQVLRNLANHVALVISTGNDHEKMDRDLDVLKIIVPDKWEDLYEKRENQATISNSQFCGKWRVLNKLLKFWHDQDDKVLVFSHSVRLLKLLQLHFQKTAYNVSYLDGSMSYDERTKAVDEFNSDPDQFVFLISTRAGGVGLNITSANKVVVFDPNWNPAFDLQAQDRAFRIGQVRDVEVFRLVSSGTIEEIVYARQIYKQQQANIGYTASVERRYFTGVQEVKEKKGDIFGLQNLFAYRGGENVLLRDIVNKTNVAESKAGFSVVGLDMDSRDDDEDDFMKGTEEDAAMNELAALVKSGGDEAALEEKARTKHKSDAIQGILANAGVMYTHENSEVIGSSKVEARLSRRAEEAGANLDEAVFASEESTARVVEAAELISEDEGFVYGHTDYEDDLDARPAPVRKAARRDVAYIFHPPEDVRQRQLVTMARMYNTKDPVEFALLVEKWTPAQRQRSLDLFYDKLRRGEVEL